MVTNDKHNPRIDDDLARHDASFLHGAPVDARAQEQRRNEGPGPRPGQASADAAPPDRGRGTSEGLEPAEVDLRAELATYIEGSVFPGERSDLLDSARRLQAPQAVIDLLEHLPEGRSYDRMEAVWEAATTR